MLTIIIFFVAFYIIGHRDYTNSWYAKNWYDGERIFLSALIGLIGAVVGLFLAIALPVSYTTNTIEYEIVSVHDNNTIKGRSYLFSGYINNEASFSFYTKDYHTYKLNSCPASNTTIHYSDNPRYVLFKDVPDDSFINLFAFDMCSEKRHELYVPDGTIINIFNLDAK